MCCLALIPLMVITGAMSRTIFKKIMEDAEEKDKDAQILCGDAVANFKTVQSFGQEHLVVDLYRDLLGETPKKGRQK